MRAALCRLIEAWLTSKDAAVSVARDGLASLHRRLRMVHVDGAETGLDTVLPAGTVLPAPAQRPFEMVTVPDPGD